MYYITISNGLLDGNHKKRMGTAVWEFMWCLDKITKIDDNGDGWVLGGKPIKLDDISGSSRNTVSRNLSKLEKEGYLKLIHTPYGISIRVHKAKKRFNKNGEPNRLPKNGEPRPKNGEPNKIEQLDITDKTSEQSSVEKEIGKVIFLFEVVNPSYKKLYGSPPQRKASARLLETHGLERLEQVIPYLKYSNSKPYFPTITTPVQLEDKWASLESSFLKEKARLQDKQNYVL